jgi:soluble lytic murein transglycosylase-like protein
MRVLAAIFAASLTFAVAFATAEPRVAKPTWSDVKRAELRLEVDHLRAENAGLRRTLRHKPSVQEAIRLASVAYGVSLTKMRRVAWCESRFNPRADNRSSTASGLYQHLYPSTWRSTPFGAESIWSPYASALAAGWMFAQGRGGEWVCQ